jgi:hypothetical protein
MSARTDPERREARLNRQRHLQEVREERELYQTHKALGAYKFNGHIRFLSVIIDGMDQNKSVLPNAGTKDATENGVKVKICGVIVHGKGDRGPKTKTRARNDLYRAYLLQLPWEHQPQHRSSSPGD